MTYTTSRILDDGAEDLRGRIERLDRLSRLLDIAFVVPGTNIRFGVDAILGLIPVVGDWAGVALSSLVILEAARIGAPAGLLARMVGNVVIEGVFGSVPVVGDVFDVFWRANRRNLALLRRHLSREGQL
jgi:hypothetical protein